MVFFSVDDIGFSQLVFIIGLPSLALGLWIQIRSLRKSQREDQEKTRKDITTEIESNSADVLKVLESRLELIKAASVISKEDIQSLRAQFIDLKNYVEEMDRDGTLEWQKVKPFVLKRMDDLEKRIEDLFIRSNENDVVKRSRMNQEDKKRMSGR